MRRWSWRERKPSRSRFGGTCMAGSGIGGRISLLLGAVILIGLGFGAYQYYGRWAAERDLLLAYPDEIPGNPRLTEFAAALGQGAIADNCASCHGPELKGDTAKGASNLTDNIWLYARGDLSDIERTILYGVRSGHPRTRNITDMPGLGMMKQLTPEQVSDVVDYTVSLVTKQGDPEILARGEKLFQGEGLCYDCHSRDGAGSPDYGAPSLVDQETLFGNDRAAILKSVNDGRHGLCPAFAPRLDLATIRGIAVYIYLLSHPKTP